MQAIDIMKFVYTLNKYVTYMYFKQKKMVNWKLNIFFNFAKTFYFFSRKLFFLIKLYRTHTINKHFIQNTPHNSNSNSPLVI